MGCRILIDSDSDLACFYDSVTMTAFGPVDSLEVIEDFERWLKLDGYDDPRGVAPISGAWESYCREVDEIAGRLRAAGISIDRGSILVTNPCARCDAAYRARHIDETDCDSDLCPRCLGPG